MFSPTFWPNNPAQCSRKRYVAVNNVDIVVVVVVAWVSLFRFLLTGCAISSSSKSPVILPTSSLSLPTVELASVRVSTLVLAQAFALASRLGLDCALAPLLLLSLVTTLFLTMTRQTLRGGAIDDDEGSEDQAAEFRNVRGLKSKVTFRDVTRRIVSCSLAHRNPAPL